MNKRIKSFWYAIKGIAFFIKTQTHAKIHILSTAVVISLGLFFNVKSYDWILLSIAIAMVVISEMFNTAIEEIVNFISPEYNKKAGVIKDIAAGAVLLSAISALIIGILVFLNYL